MKYIQRPQGKIKSFHGFITEDQHTVKLLNRLEKIALTDSSVLLRGDSGTGKELLANFIHNKSKRKDGTLAIVNCASLDSELMKSELFGHVKGAYTGAINEREGLLSVANKGTLFLDEIAEMPIEVQAKLLRVIQEKNTQNLVL